jgi:hypothetical protein
MTHDERKKEMKQIDKQNYLDREFGSLAGKTVSAVRAMSDREVAEMLWYDGEVGIVLEFTDGTYLILSKDEEGNGAGFGFLGNYGATADSTARQDLFA